MSIEPPTVAVQGEAVAHTVEEHVGVLAADARDVRLTERCVRITTRRQIGETARILDVEGIDLRLRQQGVVAGRVHHAEVQPVGRCGGHRRRQNEFTPLDAVDHDFVEVTATRCRRRAGRCRLLGQNRVRYGQERECRDDRSTNPCRQSPPHPIYLNASESRSSSALRNACSITSAQEPPCKCRAECLVLATNTWTARKKSGLMRCVNASGDPCLRRIVSPRPMNEQLMIAVPHICARLSKRDALNPSARMS
jgi:hypothetical protein